MSKQNNPYQRNKILDILQGSAEPAPEKNAVQPHSNTLKLAKSSVKLDDPKPFIYVHINELDQVLQRFKERNSQPTLNAPPNHL